MGRIKVKKLIYCTVILLLVLLAGCENNLLETLERDVERATGSIITIKVTGNGTTDPPGEIVVPKGDSSPVPISAIPDSGWAFIQWQGSGVVFGDIYSADTTVRLTGGDTTITVNFADLALGVPLMINNNGHGSSDKDGLQYVTVGQVTTAVVSPDTGYELEEDDWEVGAGNASISRTAADTFEIAVTPNPLPTILNANFVLIQYTLTVDDDGSGFGTTTPSGDVTVNHGSPFSITAEPDGLDVFFDEWTVESGSASIANASSESTTATLTAGNAVVQANFGKYGIYWGDWGAGISRSTLDWGSIDNIHGGASDICGMAFDTENGYIYYTNKTGVRRCKMDGSGAEDLVTGENQSHGICVDTVNDKIYWVNMYQLKRSNLDGSSVEILNSSFAFARGIDIDTANQKIYICDRSMRHIFEYNITSGSLSTKVPNCATAPYHLALDLVNRKIYCSDYQTGSINVFNMDTGGMTGSFPTGSYGLNGVDADPVNGYVAAVHTNSKMIYILDFDGNILQVVPIGGYYPYAVAFNP